MGWTGRWLLAFCAVALSLGLTAATAAAGGTTLRFERAEYRTGDPARATALISAVPGSGWVDDGPYVAYLIETGRWLALEGSAPQWPAVPPEARRVGEVRATPGPDTPTRAFTLDFVVPELPVGHYSLIVCTDPCTQTLGDLVGGSVDVNAPGAPPLPPIIGIPSDAAPDATPPASAPARTEAIAPTIPDSDDDELAPTWVWVGGGAVALLLAAVVVTARRGRGPSARGPSAPPGS